MTEISTGTNCCQYLQKDIKRTRDAMLCKKFFLWKLYKVCTKASLSPIFDVIFHYGDVVAPLPLIGYKDCKTEVLELPQILGMARLYYHLLEIWLVYHQRAKRKLKELIWFSSP